MRAGDWRILYEIHNDEIVVLILDVKHRSKAYDATRDQFLARRVMRFSGTWLTVRDVINQLANIEGAVHHSEARDAKERALQEVAMHYMNSGLPGAVNQIKLIGRITVRGLAPLRDAVHAGAGRQQRP